MTARAKPIDWAGVYRERYRAEKRRERVAAKRAKIPLLDAEDREQIRQILAARYKVCRPGPPFGECTGTTFSPLDDHDGWYANAYRQFEDSR